MNHVEALAAARKRLIARGWSWVLSAQVDEPTSQQISALLFGKR